MNPDFRHNGSEDARFDTSRFCPPGELCREGFRKCSHRLAIAVGSPWCFTAAILLVVAWLCCGPLFHYSDTWQLVINTSTTIITFLMVFLIQNTQNRDTKAIHLKLDELLRGVRGARTALVNLEELTDSELDELQKEFQKLRATSESRQHKPATDKAEASTPFRPHQKDSPGSTNKGHYEENQIKTNR